MVILAAAVSDYYIPLEKLSQHKIQSKEENLVITLEPVKKEIFKIKEDWNPYTFLVSFKLETDENILIKKAKNAITKTKSDLVVANLLQTRYDRVLLISPEETIEILKGEKENIEENIVDSLIKLHLSYSINYQ
jgi:phosphopantothenate-cysteine ligase